MTLDGSPLGGVTVTLTRPDNSTETATTDTAGYYPFADLTPGSYTVAPLRPRFTFTPQRGAIVKASLVDPCATAGASPNTVRDDSFSVPASNSTHGTFAIRRKFTNTSGANVTRLRFRIVATVARTSAGPPPAGTADLRALNSPARLSVKVVGTGCAGEQLVGIEGLTLEELTAAAQLSQPWGGAWNSPLAAGTIALQEPLAPGQSKNFEFLLGVEQRRAYRFFVNVEALTDALTETDQSRAGASQTKKGAGSGAPGKGQ